MPGGGAPYARALPVLEVPLQEEATGRGAGVQGISARRLRKRGSMTTQPPRPGVPSCSM